MSEDLKKTLVEIERTLRPDEFFQDVGNEGGVNRNISDLRWCLANLVAQLLQEESE